MTPPFIRSAYNYDMDEASRESGLECLDPSLTQQQFKEESDINTIVERFRITGEIPVLKHLPTYGDFEGIFDFQSAMNAVRAAEETFMSLPANIRYRFHNDPHEFVQFCSDESNHDEARKLGILAPAVKQPQENTNEQSATSSAQVPPQTEPRARRAPPAPKAGQADQEPRQEDPRGDRG